jgi:hypothetical protein
MRKWLGRGLTIVLPCLCAGVVIVLWTRSYEPPGPRLIEGPVLVKYTNLPRQLLLFFPNDKSCVYLSILHG